MGRQNLTVTGISWRAAVALTFAFAVYLMIVAIVAIIDFDQKLKDPEEPFKRITQNLAASLPTSDSPEAIKDIVDQNTDISAEVKSLEGQTKNPALAEYVKGEAAVLQTSEQHLRDEINSFGDWAKQEENTLTQQFDLENRDRPGVSQTEENMVALVDFFSNTWVPTWVKAARTCNDLVSANHALFAGFLAEAQNVLATGRGDFPQFPLPSLDNPLPSACDLSSALSSLKVPHRTLPRYGPFTTISAWLLLTESRDLALVTGMIGFGLFGALSAAFIRSDKVPDGQIKRSSYQRGIFVRGIAAAVVMYLIILGGLGLFARDATPNAYAVFFACLVAAVFSEDVWLWARQQQQQHLASNGSHHQ